MIRPTRTPRYVIAALLALMAIGVRLLVPALHTHAGTTGPHQPVAASQPLLGGCHCEAARPGLGDSDTAPPILEAAPERHAHLCLACDFELAQPAVLPPPAAMPAMAAIQLRAPPRPDEWLAAARLWAPPMRGPPRRDVVA